MQCDFLRALPLWSNSVKVCGLLHHQPCIQQSKTVPETRIHSIIYCMCLCIQYDKEKHPYILTHMWTVSPFVWAAECAAGVSANGSDMRRQQVIDEDDVVLWHNRFPLCPGWGWGLLCVPPVIAWRIDSEQCAISRTVIKPHYSFFTTPIWVLETQWPTLKPRWWLYDHCLSSSLSSTPLSLLLHHLFTSLLNHRSHLSSLPSLFFHRAACYSVFFSSLHSPSLSSIKPECLASELSSATSVMLKKQSS